MNVKSVLQPCRSWNWNLSSRETANLMTQKHVFIFKGRMIVLLSTGSEGCPTILVETITIYLVYAKTILSIFYSWKKIMLTNVLKTLVKKTYIIIYFEICAKNTLFNEIFFVFISLTNIFEVGLIFMSYFISFNQKLLTHSCLGLNFSVFVTL